MDGNKHGRLFSLRECVLLSSLEETVQSFERENIKKLAIRRVSTGMKSLDCVLGGGISAGLYVLGAIPNLGKSTFVLQIAQNISSSGTPVLFFSMEMTKKRIASKALSRQLFIDTRNPRYSSDLLLNENSVTDNALWKHMRNARREVEEACRNMYIIERNENVNSAQDIADVVEDYLDEQGEDNKPVVIVDYLQILSGNKENNFVSDRAIVDYNIRVLTTLAMRNQIPIIAISSFNRTNYQVEVSMESFKESGAIEYSADVIMGMQLSAVGSSKFDLNKEKMKNPRDIDIVILKQRYGQSGNKLSFKYYPVNDYFEECGKEEDVDDFFPEYPERRLD